MRDALNVSGFCHSIMNNDNIPLDLVNMGLEKGKDHFSFVMRANIFQDSLAGWDYIYNIEKYFTVLRIIPQSISLFTPLVHTKNENKGNFTNEFQVILPQGTRLII